MNDKQILLLRAMVDAFQPEARRLIEAGYRPEIVVLAPEELPRIEGYKVCLVVPLG